MPIFAFSSANVNQTWFYPGEAIVLTLNADSDKVVFPVISKIAGYSNFFFCCRCSFLPSFLRFLPSFLSLSFLPFFLPLNFLPSFLFLSFLPFFLPLNFQC
jgi:hypothetical protein